ncbi:MAG: transcription repressor NadR [Oscillospiraceae bacterium]|nr:transcription repressor NadR [Eubacteriales bacterium]MDY2617577.1 transcription repressor NadR [Oscillospiraceae bacterium]
MNAKVRRSAILARLKHENGPVSATALAKEHGVSRQIIVGDIALLRAGGEPISATPRGYLLDRENAGELHTVAVRHTTQEMERELQICVDNGCTVLDVVVEHPVYGQLVGQLQLSSRYDVEQFLNRSRSGAARPLSDLTGGIHLHRLLCPDEAAYRRVCRQLDEAGILLKDQ